MKTALLIITALLITALALPLLGLLLRLFISVIAAVTMLAVSLIAGIGYSTRPCGGKPRAGGGVAAITSAPDESPRNRTVKVLHGVWGRMGLS